MGGTPYYIIRPPLGAGEPGAGKNIYIYMRERAMSSELLWAVVHPLPFLNSGAHSLNYASTRQIGIH